MENQIHLPLIESNYKKKYNDNKTVLNSSWIPLPVEGFEPEACSWLKGEQSANVGELLYYFRGDQE